MGLVCYYCETIGIITKDIDGKATCQLCQHKAKLPKKKVVE